ncbi:hypothetical protein Trydic_g11808 [Trypoxylus dichotomus]
MPVRRRTGRSFLKRIQSGETLVERWRTTMNTGTFNLVKIKSVKDFTLINTSSYIKNNMRQFLPDIGISKLITPQNQTFDLDQDLEEFDDFYEIHNEAAEDTEESNETDNEENEDNQPPPQNGTPTISNELAELYQRQAEARLLIASIPEENFTYVTDDTAFVTKSYLGIDPSTGLIEVFVHLNKKENFILQRTATVENLKQMIAERKGIPVDIQRLVFAGKVLQNDTTLQENKIMCGSSIHLFIRLRGGCTNNCNVEAFEADVTNAKTENYM